MEVDKAPELVDLQEDDEFEEFQANQDDFTEVKGLDDWEEDWDDDIKQDDFATALRNELGLSA